MNDREPPGYDDWFDEPEPPTLEQGRAGRPSYDAPGEAEEDVWVLPEDELRRARRTQGRGDIVIGGRALTTTQVAILAIAALAIIIAIVAAAGGFSSGAASTTPSVPTQTTLPKTSTTPTTPNVVAPTQPLQEGDTNHAQVKRLQQALTALGFSPGKADGSFGPSTKTEVEDFQSAHGLSPDGVVGTQTLKALKQALGG